MRDIGFNLYLITDRLNLPAGKDLLDQVEAALRGGVRAVQLREKDLAAAELLPLAQRMRELTARYGAKLLINGDIETVLAARADGVHLPSDNPPVAAARRQLGPQALVGVSTHAVEEIESAAQDGADFVTFGPVYATPSKLAYGPPAGPEKLERACRQSVIPVFALGGVTPGRVADLHSAGCRHCACIGAILNADRPEDAAGEFLRQLTTGPAT